MTNHKKNMINDLNAEIKNCDYRIKHLLEQLQNIPKIIEEVQLERKNLEELISAVHADNSFTDPVFSYENNEEDYD